MARTFGRIIVPRMKSCHLCCRGRLSPFSAYDFLISASSEFLSKSRMFVGHYGVAFALKSEKNKIPLWVLFVAVQFLDYIWATLVLLGIEKLRVIKGFTAGSMLDSYFHPYSHSLITVMAWSGVAALLYKTIWRAKASSSAAVIVGLAAFSHWI